jgi:hypothetical protein
MLLKIRYTAFATLLVLVVALANTASAGLVGWWKFDETGGTTAKDASGQANDGRIVGNAKWVSGKIGGALEFDGSTYVDCGNKASLNIRNQITMSFWFKVQAFQNTWEAFLSKGDGAYRASRSNGTGDSVHMGISGGNYFDATAPIVTDNQWHHYAGIYDGTTATIYVDGVMAATRTYGGQIGDSSAYNLYLGENSQATGRLLHGLLDDVRIYDRALTEQQLLDLIDNGISPSWNKAEKPVPADGATGVALPLLSWSKGDDALSHNVYVGTAAELTAANLVGPRWPSTTFYYTGAWTPGTLFYWRVDEVGKDGTTIYPGDVWKFTSAPLTAYAPAPRNGDKWIATDTSLSWQPGQGNPQHEVYFSTDKDAVVNRDASAFIKKQAAFTYDPGALELNTTYYWAIDEVTLAGKVPGELWKFTTVGTSLGGVKGEYYNGTTPSGAPQLSRIDPEINFSWGDPGGPGAPIGTDNFSARWTADLEIAIADSYTFITTSDDGVRLWLNDQLIIDNWTDHGTADNYTLPMALEPGVYSLRMEYYEATGGAVAQLSWQSPNFARQIIPAGPLQPPVRARALYPQSGDANIPQDLTLMWGAGEKAVKHQIYFGDDADAVAAANTSSSLYKGEQALDATTFDPGLLEWNKSYFWRVDEVNEASDESPWVGTVWSFTTADFLVVDDIEAYNDEEDTGTRIYETWIDGYTDGLSGSTVGNLNPPFAEQTIVHGGKQSMPMDYNNINSPYFSQAYREFSPVQNWTVNGLSDLVLWVRGYQAPLAPVTESGGQMTVTGEGTDIWGTADQFTYVFKTLNGDGAISARVTSNGTGSNAWAKGGVMIRDGLDAGSAHATAVMTGGSGGGNGGSFQYRLMADSDSANSDAAAVIAPPYYVKVERKGDTLTASFSADGTNWTVQGEPQFIAMMAPAYIGICVTSHAAGELRTFEFDKITVTGASGTWQTREVGLSRNSQQPLYVIVEDSSNKKVTVVDPNAAAVNATQWTEWKIPLTDLAGVSLNKVKRLYIGVGDPQNATPDGTGRIYIDDIRVMKPAPAEPNE